jgi:hypothetical protein
MAHTNTHMSAAGKDESLSFVKWPSWGQRLIDHQRVTMDFLNRLDRSSLSERGVTLCGAGNFNNSVNDEP